MTNLLRLLGKRLASLPLVAFGVVFLVFFLMSFSRYDPAVAALGENATTEQLDAYRAANGLNNPWYVRFFIYIWNMLHGDLGTYGVNHESVAAKIGQAFPITLQLTFIGLVVVVVVAALFGVLAALFRDTWVDQAIRVVSIIAIATPSFWLGVLLIYVLQIKLGLLPGAGILPNFFDDPAGYLARMAMPAFSLGLPVAGQLIRVIRTSMVEELDKDYVRTAIGAGIPKAVVVSRNVLRNALITPITVLGMKIGYLMGGAIVIEVIFALPGMGTTLFEGINGNEPILVQGVVLVVALSFVIINIIVDLLYVLINPRIRTV
ncbi:ABC transporter permease [Alloscardovia macacae]|uniref:ABC transporter permease n=1 Tax=Alloscardovia macacae TaxID=1160091 RepID=A0A1Y2SXM2_9BIFI|nr:ABC transporter permease [Alloscardovia macacae]OTA25967.1 ABC transporter permease [Alloscardovia macacae]OTA28734.1 ABC transporter permease [Alloscardovia macacae]OZG54788.1 ABC transporter permease [Alloscardovia macacae]